MCNLAKLALNCSKHDELIADGYTQKIFELANRLKIFMMQENIAEVLLKYANKDSQVALVGRCITVLANLSSHRENHCKLFESGVLLSIVDFPNNNCDSRIQNDIATIFCFLSSHPKHLDGAFGVHIVKAMLHLVSFHDNNCSWISALALGNLADSDENKKMIISCDGIEPIAALLQETNSENAKVPLYAY